MKGEIMLSQIEMKYYKDVTRIADCLERIADVLQDSYEQKWKTTAKQPTEDGGEKGEQGH